MSEHHHSPEIDRAIELLSPPGYDCIESREAMQVLFDWGQLAVAPLNVELTGVDATDRPIQECAPLTICVVHSGEDDAVVH